MRNDDPDRPTPAPNSPTSGDEPRWREQFPIDVDVDEYRSRRDFTKLLGLTSLACVFGQGFIVLQSTWRKTRGPLPLRDIAGEDEVPVGGAKLFDYPDKGDSCVLVRLSPDRFVAYGQKCTHLSCPVIPRPAEGKFHCPCHEGSFDINTGEPLSGPPRRPLPRVVIEVRNGRIVATGMQDGLA